MAKKDKVDEQDMFWADQLAEKIPLRDSFHYTEDKPKKLKQFTVKTSASLSGVLHIGRLSDTIRGESVARALRDAGQKVRFIWVAEDMDPFRKVPKGMPEDYVKFLGRPVTDVPDPDGCHDSYAEHHVSAYFKVIERFTSMDMERFSMRQMYKQGAFKPYIKTMMENIGLVKEIQNKFRKEPLADTYTPWTPICKECGKIVTPKLLNVNTDGTIEYVCEDYDFEKTKAIGCGYKGVADPVKDDGKLMWKGEWAAQWSYWNVVAEGAGKEYQVPNSAFWVNAEICEKIFKFIHPEPIFYEHIMVDNVKMSASLGNVIYPKDWLDTAPADLLRFFYNKRLMKTRSFSWKDLPKFYEDFDSASRIFFGEGDAGDKQAHMKRLYEISNIGEPMKPINMTFNHAIILAQVFDSDELMVNSLKKTGQYDESMHSQILERIAKARAWLDKYAPEESKFELQSEVPAGLELTPEQKAALAAVVASLDEKDWDEKELHNKFYEICENTGCEIKDFFKAAYNVLLNQDRGPKLAGFILSLGKERVSKLFEKV